VYCLVQASRTEDFCVHPLMRHTLTKTSMSAWSCVLRGMVLLTATISDIFFLLKFERFSSVFWQTDGCILNILQITTLCAGRVPVKLRSRKRYPLGDRLWHRINTKSAFIAKGSHARGKRQKLITWFVVVSAVTSVLTFVATAI
jgi:hypothetical protein